MDSGSSSADPQISFETPWHQRTWGWMSVAIAFFFVALFIPGMVWGVVGFSRVWQSPPWWWHVIGLGLFALGACLVVRASRDALTRRLVVGERGWHLDGVRAGPMMAYEQVKLLQLEENRRSTGIGKMRQLVIELRSGNKRSIWLRDRDARECLDAMHELCQQAIAIDPEGEARLPVDEGMHALAHATLARRYRRRGWLAVAGAATVLLFSIFRTWMWLASVSSRPPIAAFLIRSAIQLGVFIWIVVMAVRWFRLARAHSQSIVPVAFANDAESDDDLDDD
jgi:hypothetical protein